MDYVLVPRELAETFDRSASPPPSWAVEKLRAILAQPADQHQADPVALPAPWTRQNFPAYMDDNAAMARVETWNACLDEIAKLGPLYSRPAHGEPFFYAMPARRDDESCNPVYQRRAEGWNACLDEIAKLGPLYAHPDSGEVERLRAQLADTEDSLSKVRHDFGWQNNENEKLNDLLRQERSAVKTLQDAAQGYRTQLAERDALLREVVNGKSRIQFDGDLMHRILMALSASAEPSAPECKCDMRTRLVGDGCATCNPELAADLMEPSAPVEPKCEDCNDTGMCMSNQPPHWNDMVPCTTRGCSAAPGAPVEQMVVDEDRECEKAFSALGHDRADYWVRFRAGWQNKIALERKP